MTAKSWGDCCFLFSPKICSVVGRNHEKEMGQHLPVIGVSTSTKCMVLQCKGRRHPPSQVFLVPVTAATMPSPQSPLCAMLNDAQNLPWAVHWAWPPIREVERDGFLKRNVEERSGYACPTPPEPVPREATFAQAAPHFVDSAHDGTDLAVGHLVSLVAIETPAGFPLPGACAVHRELFFDFSDSWMTSLCHTPGCAVVGYFRYLQLVDVLYPHAGALPETEEQIPSLRSAPPITDSRIVGVIDHYLYNSFRSEARALMLLQSVSLYVQRLALIIRPNFGGSPPTLRTTPAHVVVRCKAGYLPQLRLMEKVYRILFVSSAPEGLIRINRLRFRPEVAPCPTIFKRTAKRHFWSRSLACCTCT
jgi:hypothetical protein